MTFIGHSKTRQQIKEPNRQGQKHGKARGVNIYIYNCYMKTAFLQKWCGYKFTGLGNPPSNSEKLFPTETF